MPHYLPQLCVPLPVVMVFDGGGGGDGNDGGGGDGNDGGGGGWW